MDVATVGGFALTTILIVIVMQISGSILMFWDLTSIIVVLGGSLGSTMMRWPINKVIGSIKVGVHAVMNGVDDAEDLINEIVELTATARKESILALEKVSISNVFLAKAVKMMVDGRDEDYIVKALSTEIRNSSDRHKDGRGFFENMGESCPAFGMIGTVIGLIVIMANLTDPTAIGPGLAVALVTTLYGSMISNMVFIPLAQKLKYRADAEERNMRLILEGARSMLQGTNPNVLRDALESFMDR